MNIKNNSKTKWLIVVLFIIIILLGGSLLYMKHNEGKSDKDNNQVSETVMNQSEEMIESSYLEIDTPYLTLKFPEQDSAALLHEEEHVGDAVVEVFYMKTEGNDLPLYRIDFGDENLGEWLGVIKTDTEEIPVTYTVFSATEEELQQLGVNLETYSVLMNDFNVLLNCIYEDSRFSSEKENDVVEEKEIELMYWNVTLPESISCSENVMDGNYQADFYIEIQGEQVNLYSVYIGDEQAETILGQYKIEDRWEPISIESYDLRNSELSDEELLTAYQMLDTINDVIETISKSKQFTNSLEIQNQ